MVRYFALAVLFGLLALPAVVRAQELQDANAQTPLAGDTFMSDPQGAITRARELIAAGNLSGAIKQLEAYVVAHPNEPAPQRFLGDLYFREGKFADAEAQYYAILRRSPDDRETHNRLGTVYAMENRVDDAIGQFDASLPGADSVGDLVALHLRKGDLPAYRQRMEGLALHNPESADLQSELGQVYEAMHQPSQAVTQFQKAIHLEPQSLVALNGLGLAYLDEKDYEDAAAQLSACLTLDPMNYPCADNLAATYLESRKFADAERMLKSAHHLAPERPEALVNYGYLADVRNDWKGAIAYYIQAINVWPYSRDAYVNLGVDYEEHGLYPLAEQALLKGVAAAPDDGRIHYLLGRAYEAQNKPDLAMQQFRVAETSLDPDIARIAQQSFDELKSAKPQ